MKANILKSDLRLQLVIELEKCRELDGKLGVKNLRTARVAVVNALVEIAEQLGYDVTDIMEVY